MKLLLAAPSLVLVVLLALSACGKPGDAPSSPPSSPPSLPPPSPAIPPATPPAPLRASPPAAQAAARVAAPVETGIAWLHASNGADVDLAFAQARRESRPLFLYWGASWCPPCNQLKATLFNRQDFIARSRAFIPVYIDGDSVGAQKLAARFKVSGYPTTVLFSPQGVEVTRLPGEVDAERYSRVLTLAISAARPVKELLAQALAGGEGLTANDWRLLGFYSWDTDQQQLVAKDGLPALLERLAAACPDEQAEVSQRLRLQAIAAAATSRRAGSNVPEARAMLLRLLGDPQAARMQTDVLVDSAADITRALSSKGTPQRQQLLTAFDTALQRMEVDTSLSRADRLGALGARVDLAKIDAPKSSGLHGAPGRSMPRIPEALLADVRDTAARDDRDISDGYERQAVITAAADVLAEAGLATESDALLKANRGKSHSPYYLMSELAGNAKRRGDRSEALRWYQAAFDASVGPATRLQWGAAYVGALIDLAPQDDARIEKAAAQVIGEAAATADGFDGRSGRSLQRLGTKLQAWDGGSRHDAVLRRLQARLDGACARLPASDGTAATCYRLLGAHRAAAPVGSLR